LKPRLHKRCPPSRTKRLPGGWNRGYTRRPPGGWNRSYTNDVRLRGLRDYPAVETVATQTMSAFAD